MDTTPTTRIGEPEEPHDVTLPRPDHHVNYYAVFGVLIVLTVVTVAVAFFHIKSELVKVLLALTIATVKATAVAMFFMHLKFEGKLIYLILLVPVFLCIVLILALIPDIVHSPLFNELTPYPGPAQK